MPPTTKDFDVAASNSAVPATDDATKPQPVALEVPVTVNGARTVDGSDKREPFSESTNTVLVFGHGAVIRLASAVSPGQLLFLTNDKTKKEVVCQVVKSKNYRNVSGYVELEFTENIAGFWGMRFPGERSNTQPVASAPATIKNPVAPLAATPRPLASVPPPPQAAEPKIEVPTFASLSKRPEPQPLSAAPPPSRTETPIIGVLKTEPKSVASSGFGTKAVSPVPQAPDRKPASTLPRVPGSPDALTSSVWLPSESKPVAPVVIKVPPAGPPAPIETPSMEELKRESARLQEQFASMLLGVDAPAKPAPPTPISAGSNKPASDSAPKVIELGKNQPSAATAEPPAKSASLGAPSSLDAEEVKIPSWLEPLARNVATPAHNEIAPREERGNTGSAIEFEVQDVSAPPTPQETTAPPEEAASDPDIESLRELIATDRVPHKSNKGILIGAIAAGLTIMIAGGTWYMRQSGATARIQAGPVVPSTTGSAAAVAPAKNTLETPAASSASLSANAVTPSSNSSAMRSQTTTSTPTAEPLKAAQDKNTVAELSAYRKLAEPQPLPVQPQPKKPILGEVHLAAPSVNHSALSPSTDSDVVPAPALSAGTVSSSDALDGGLTAGSAKQPAAPAAPLPVGGDVKAARLISSVPPGYPMLAKNQHAEGDVRIDALIDADGRVSSMKVVSGPVLLRQAAMDALRQWKYQPATLDGKPVSMHLTVTLQFHLQ
jgi:periplasmic protein TonB